MTNIPEAQVNGTAQIDDMEDVQEAASPSESNSGGSAMDESDDSYRSEERPSIQEEAAVSSPLADAEPVLEAAGEASIDHSNSAASGHPLPRQSLSAAEEDSMIDDQSPAQETEQSQRETSEESDDYEPPEPDTGAESPGSAYSPPLSPAPLAILDGPPNSAPLNEQPPNEVFMSAPPPVPAWEPRQMTEILGAPGVRIPLP